MQSRAVIFAEMGKPLLVEQVDYDDEVAPGHALVRNFASGVCHSQLHALHGHTNPTLPMVLGHESTGEVVAVGDGVDHVAPGDKVLVGWLPRNPQPGAGRTVSSPRRCAGAARTSTVTPASSPGPSTPSPTPSSCSRSRTTPRTRSPRSSAAPS